ncbi:MULTISPECIES: class I SAM-dependent methyltransferase [unclassified Frankia]
MTTDDPHGVKNRGRIIWTMGDYQLIADRQLPIAEALCDWAGVRAGQRVVDVATATGNVALAAGRRGALVTAVDITPRMVELARARAQEAGLEITVLEGDAEDLPLSDASCDVALSACGIWFAPRPDAATAEVHRVLRPGGQVGLANFTPTGFMGRLNAIIKRRLPLPESLPEPNEWGVRDVVLPRLTPYFHDIECISACIRYSFPTAAAAADFFLRYSPPHVAALISLDPPAARELRQEIESCFTENSVVADRVELDAEYLLVRAQAR